MFITFVNWLLHVCELTRDVCKMTSILWALWANWELIIMLVHNKPVKRWINNCEYNLLTSLTCIWTAVLRNEYESDLWSNEHYLSCIGNKAWNWWITGLFWTYIMTSSQLVCKLSWLRALNQYHRGHGFKSHTGLNLFSSGLIFTTVTVWVVFITRKITFIFIS